MCIEYTLKYVRDSKIFENYYILDQSAGYPNSFRCEPYVIKHDLINPTIQNKINSVLYDGNSVFDNGMVLRVE
jgi:hypothetical protein